ncbi:MAG: LicD family protein [Dialister sp.]|nr:LicD family protein [Dialister sp.]
MKQISLSELHSYLLESLIAFDSYCRSHNIRYSLCGGTLIGAVRHEGFIPWDDDTDVMMTRDAYDQLTDAWRKAPLPGYTLLTDRTPNHAYAGESGKWYADNTAPLHPDNEYDIGLFLDIFIADRLPRDEKEAEAYFHKTHGIGKRFHSVNKRRHHWLWKCLSYISAALSPDSCYRELEAELASYRDRDGDFLALILGSGKDMKRERMPRKFFDSYVELVFEGHSFPVIAEYDAYLRHYYGDYMRLPPEQERLSHHKKNHYLKR